MKPLDEEILIEEIFTIVRKACPELKTPPPDMVNLMNSSRIGGRGGPNYGISINLIRFKDLSLGNYDLLRTVVHELIHYNGVMNHSISFWDKLNESLAKVLVEIKKGGTKDGKEERKNKQNNSEGKAPTKRYVGRFSRGGKG